MWTVKVVMDRDRPAADRVGYCNLTYQGAPEEDAFFYQERLKMTVGNIAGLKTRANAALAKHLSRSSRKAELEGRIADALNGV